MSELGMSRTVAIIDFAHSGTTMLAGLCQILGVSMVGDNYKEHKMEDLDVVAAIRREKRFARLIEERNEQHPYWGFKMPGAWKFPASLSHLRNPIYLAIYKDPATVAMRRFGIISLNKIDDTLEQMKLSTESLLASGLPVRVLSYQRAIVAPEIFTTELGHILGLPVGDRLVEAVNWIQPNIQGRRMPYPRLPQWS
jgi:hypothetical protein